MTRVLVTGASGLLGANLVMVARRRHDVFAVSYQHPIDVEGVQSVTADLTKPSAAQELIGDLRPAWVVHCAAAADVDRCERDPAWAAQLNVEAAAGMAGASAKAGARLLHISTDAVFDGGREGYREDDATEPLNTYGRTKLEGERAVRLEHPHAAILRTTFFGWHPFGNQGLAEWLVDRLESSQAAPGFVDSWFAPLLVNDLSELILEIARLELEGTYHLTGVECISKYEFGRRLAREFGWEEGLLQPAKVDEAGLLAPRPHKLCLDCSKLVRQSRLKLPGVSEGISRFRRLKETGYVDELKRMPAAGVGAARH